MIKGRAFSKAEERLARELVVAQIAVLGIWRMLWTRGMWPAIQGSYPRTRSDGLGDQRKVPCEIRPLGRKNLARLTHM